MTPEPGRLLDRALPRWDFTERHERLVQAPAPLVWRALGEVRMTDLPVTRVLMRIRMLGRRPSSAADRLALEALPPAEIARDEGRELLLVLVAPTSLRTDAGSLDAFRPASMDELLRPLPDGWVRIGMDFRLAGRDGATRLSTETRVLATGPAARRRFRLYWLAIRGGSGLIRRELLRAVARCAERGA
jgi:hypothetical protein